MWKTKGGQEDGDTVQGGVTRAWVYTAARALEWQGGAGEMFLRNSGQDVDGEGDGHKGRPCFLEQKARQT